MASQPSSGVTANSCPHPWGHCHLHRNTEADTQPHPASCRLTHPRLVTSLTSEFPAFSIISATPPALQSFHLHGCPEADESPAPPGYNWRMTSWLLQPIDDACSRRQVLSLLSVAPSAAGGQSQAFSPVPSSPQLLLTVPSPLSPNTPTWNLGELAFSALDFI